MAICAIGDILRVMYSTSLRGALMTTSGLPYPEGIAATEVLEMGDLEGGPSYNRHDMQTIIVGGLASAGFSLLVNLKVAAAEVIATFKAGSFATRTDTGASMGLFGVGHLVGLNVGIFMIVGVMLSFGAFLPTIVWGNESATASGGAIKRVFID